jgi:predicted Rossmann fold flavoprotein
VVYDCLVVGGGASGMMAALSAKEEGASVCILEKNNLLGKKILATGNGRCNFTNEKQNFDCYFSGNREVAEEVLHRFHLERTLVFFSKIGVLSRVKDGYYYPRSNQASSVRYCLEKAVMAKGVDFRPSTTVIKIKKEKDIFVISTDQGEYRVKKCILCGGGMASPKSGSDGSVLKIAKSFGHHVIKPLPALVQLVCKEKFFFKLKGVRAMGSVTLFVNDKKTAYDEGEIQFTKDGISGIPVFNISRHAVRALDQKKEVYASLDLFPDFSFDVLVTHLRQQLLYRSYPVTMKDGLIGMLNEHIIGVVLKGLHYSCEDSTNLLSEDDIRSMASLLKDFRVQIIGSHDFESAQVTSGGVDLNEVTNYLESKKVPGLYFAGELLDVDGICGGYNLQWAWSSGYIAGKCVLE